MQSSNQLIRVAWFSPVEPSQNGQKIFSKSEYVSSVILPKLRDKLDIELFTSRAGQTLQAFESRHYLTAYSRHQQKPFDIFLYNLENGKHSDFVRLHLALIPGVTWLHDFTLIDDGPEPILNSPWIQFVKAFAKDIDLDSFVWPSKLEEHLPKRPQAFREVGMSLFSLFSAGRDLEQYRQLNPIRLNLADRGRYLPLPIDLKNINTQKRCKDWPEFRVASASSPTVDSHMHCLLEALSKCKNSRLTWLIDPSERIKCEELIAEFELSNVDLVLGRTIDVWTSIINKSDLVFHCLHTFYQQSNPWLALALAQAAFCVVLDFSESDYLPLNAAIRIQPGRNEVGQLTAIFKLLQDQNQISNPIAREFALEHYDAEVIARELLTIFVDIAPVMKKLKLRWDKFSELSRKNLFEQNVIDQEPQNLIATNEIFSELGWL